MKYLHFRKNAPYFASSTETLRRFRRLSQVTEKNTVRMPEIMDR